jgi:hypothetical protein
MMQNFNFCCVKNAGIACMFSMILLSGCASYTTPGGGVSVGNLSQADSDIGDILKRQPAAQFPARMAVARVQASGYSSRSNGNCYGSGQFCVLTTRDIESEADFARLASNALITDVALMSRIILPSKLQSTHELRLAAASLKTDVLLIYSMDTGFTVENTEIGPLGAITLGLLPTKKARVTATASAALYDVRTGFLYGVAEASAKEEQRGSFWTSSDAIDQARLKAEAEAFKKLVDETEKLFANVAGQYGVHHGFRDRFVLPLR